VASRIVDHSSTPVPSSLALGQWVFGAVTRFVLAPGDYVLGAFYESPVKTTNPNDPGDDGILSTSAITLIPNVTFTGGVRIQGSALSFPDPDLTIKQESAFLGPNLSVRSTQVPEPSSMLLLGAGLTSIAGRYRPKT
jgi:hypothetical protein